MKAMDSRFRGNDREGTGMTKSGANDRKNKKWCGMTGREGANDPINKIDPAGTTPQNTGLPLRYTRMNPKQ